MPLLACANLKYTIGTRTLIDGASFSIEAGERVGLVGRNGCGKTTLMRLLSGRLKPDSGSVSTARGARIGYLTQDPELDHSKTLREEAASGFAQLIKLHAELDALFHDMALPENSAPHLMERLLSRQSDLQHQIESMGGFAVDHLVDQILHGLGFTDSQFSVPVSALSGGQKGRLALAKLLLESPELLLLDEPTNHLDIAGCEWLEDFLNNEFKGAVLMISHDRRMLDNVVHRIEEVEQGRLIEYPGNYTAFCEIRKQRLLTQARAYDNQQSQWAKEEEFIRRFKAGQRAKEAQGRLSKLERQKELFALERPTEVGVMNFRLPDAPRSGDQVVVVREACKSYTNAMGEEAGAPVATKVLFKNLTVTISRGERWAIIGPNGAGKTTLVRAILDQLPLDSGTTKIGSSVNIGYYQQLPPNVDGDLKVYEFLQHIIKRENPTSLLSEQQARDLAGAFLFSGQDQDKPIGSLSGGERSRARLAGLLASAKNLIILDEPTNHLDIPSCERLEDALRIEKDELGNPLSEQPDDKYQGTVILISHDRALIDAVCDHLIVLDGEGNAEVFVGTYGEYHRKKLDAARASTSKSAAKTNAKPAAKPSSKNGAKPDPKPEPAAPSPWTTTPSNPTKPASKASTKSKFSWMQPDRLDKEITKATSALKAAERELEKEEVYRDANRCRAAIAERDRLADELSQLEEEWLRRAEA